MHTRKTHLKRITHRLIPILIGMDHNDNKTLLQIKLISYLEANKFN